MKKRIALFAFLFILFGGIGLASNITTLATEVTNETTAADETVVFYKGVANSTVNVRLGPGAEYDKLVVDSEPVQLKASDEVVIIGEAKATDGKVWYNIRFDYKGNEVEGFSTSSYVAKTDEEITPTPTPSPTPEPTPTPKPEPTLTSVPTQPLVKPNDVDESTRAQQENDINKYIVIVAGAFGLFLLLVIVLKIVRKLNKNKKSDMSDKVDKIKNVRLDNSEDNNANKKRKPQVKRLPDVAPLVETTREEVYLAGIEPDDSVYNEDFVTNDASNVLESASKEALEKKELREKIDKLQEHDIVIHKYFGEGEVYDNSDVNLLEVRFDNDVRFLNKDSLVSKKLLEIPDDDQQIHKKRSNNRRGGRKNSTNKND